MDAVGSSKRFTIKQTVNMAPLIITQHTKYFTIRFVKWLRYFYFQSRLLWRK
jgi:hypothetical protein